MSNISSWLINHKYELVNEENDNRRCKIRDISNGSKKILKIMDISELDQKVVEEVVSKMNVLNEMRIDGLLKYRLIEVSGNSLYRISREYKIHLDKINPLKYFEEIGVYEVLNGILLVLKVLSENDLIHSDLKPSNVFLNEENEVIIGDYLNNLLYKGREGKRNAGKIEDFCFVSIDELCGLELDISSDIWNFGLIYYYVLSGKYPFHGSNMFETMRNIENVKYDLIDREYDSEKLNSFLSKILVKEKSKRMKLNKIEKELKKLNEAELPVIPFEEEIIEIDERLKKKINSEIEKCKKENETKMYYAGFHMKKDGMKYVCSRLETMDYVACININRNELSPNCLNIFSKCLKFFPNLEILYLGVNPIGKGGLKVLSENLHFIPKLKELYVNSCRLVDEDVKDLVSHFKDISSLKRVDIDSDDGVKYLCENINEIPKLKVLYIHTNLISDAGGEILISNLHKCKKLRILYMGNNKISNYEDFKRRMKENHPNKELKIDPILSSSTSSSSSSSLDSDSN